MSKVVSKGVRRAPLIPLPIMDEPFRTIAMDIVGRYILVICDYATRYPEAVRTIDANTIAEELLVVFSRVGIPEEMLTDQDTNFTSQFLSEIYRLLQIRPIRTTPYHPQTDGLVERFNGTLKAMLRKVAAEEGRDWDRLLPYMLFAYREVPQASTGFSPFELLYGRNVRGPLDILKESWDADRRGSESVVSYILMIQYRLTQLRDIVHKNLKDAQRTWKEWHDRHARNLEFQPGDQVLVLLPTSTNKLLAEWRGHYPIERKISDVNYEIWMTDSRKKRIFHVNMLREWHSPSAASFLAEEVIGEPPIQADDVVLRDGTGADESEKPLITSRLKSTQRAELNELLQEFDDVLSSRPGKTQLAECCVNTGRASPIHHPPYRLPHAYRDIVKSELEHPTQS